MEARERIPGRIDELIAGQAVRRPDAVAVEFGPQRLTYRELTWRADEVASELRTLGCGPGSVVGIAAERSPELVVAMLGVLRAGAAYLPLDPGYPPERLTFMVNDAQATVILTQPHLESRLPDREVPVRFVATSPGPAEGRKTPADAAPRSVSQIAYIIYTSGSTGTPKGVAVQHRSLVNLVWDCGFARLDQDETVLQFTSSSFDVSAFEIWGALVNGCRLVIAPPGPLSMAELTGYIESHGVTTLWLTAGLLPQLDETTLPRLHCLRQFIVGGDVVAPTVCAEILRTLPGVKLINGYGPTETTVFAATQPISEATLEPSVPIGRPVRKTTAYVLDSRLRPAGAGEAGELYIGGQAVAIGYLGRPSLTAQRFVPDPFSGRPGSRMYRTGDLARFLPDGTLQFIGRVDDQLKVRGYRVEPSEIVSALRQHPEVRSAFVMAHGQGADGKQLVAYVLSEDPAPSARRALAARLRDYLHGLLPDYMVPTLFMVLESFPVNANGKLDRAALPPPQAHEHDPADAARGPQTDTEKALTEAWLDVTGPDAGPISVDADLFSAGGDSLRMTSLVSRVSRVLGVELPLREVFEHRTLAALAARIERLQGERRAVGAITVAPRGQKIPLTHAQQRMWFLEQLQPGTAAYNVPLLIRLTGTVDEAVMARSLRDLVRRHESLRTVFAGAGEAPYQLVLDSPAVDVPVVDLRPVPEECRDDAIRQRVSALVAEPFDLATGPLVRACLLRVSEIECLLLIVAHHIVTDGWSMDVMLRDLSTRYDASVRGGHDPLMPLPVQYPDFARWQQDYRQGDALQGSMAYWRAQLSDAPRLLALPTDRRRPPVQTLNGGSVWISLERAQVARLRRLGLDSGHTFSMTLIAALAIILHRQSGQDEVVIGSLVANRTQPESENLVGLFINTLALRFSLHDDPALSTLLEHVRSVCLDAYTHQDVPFERLVDELHLERDLSRTPLFQVLFNHITTRVDNVQAGGIRWHREHAEETSAKYDLSLYVWEGADDVQCQFIYNQDLFDRARVSDLAEQYVAVLTALADRPDSHLSGISLATANGRRIVPDPEAAVPVPNVPDLVSRVRAVCARHPGRTAMVEGDAVWSYADLAQRVRAAAVTLRAQGVRPGDMVPVIAGRTAWLAVSVLAILSTGATVVFLDPAAPTDWLRQRLSEIEPTAVVAVGAIPDGLAGRWAVPVVRLAEQEDLPEAGAADYAVNPAAPAFVLYTSGTTGRPKAVVSSQLPLCRFLDWQAGHFGLTGEDRVGVLSGLAHDPILRDMFAALWVGGQVHWPAEAVRQEPARLAEWMDQQAVTAVHLTPTLLEMIRTGNEETAPSLRYLFLGGEALTRRHVREAAQWAPNATCVNFYGTTETPQAAGYFVVPESGEPEPEQAAWEVPLGRGSAEAQLLVLSSAGHPAGIGELGEIVVRSPYLALGYLSGRHTVDGSDFRPEPTSSGSQAPVRTYRTGDLGRYRPDGTVEYAGRNDRQINLRGYRIAPQEIEAALKANPDVWEAVAFEQEAPNSHGPVLTACVVPQPGTAPTPAELRDYLIQTLPAYLVPQHVMLTDMLPVTSNGKIDVEALRANPPRRPETREPAEIGGEIETALAGLWRDILGEAPADADQSFFESGNSLLGAVYMSRVRKLFGVDVPLRELFSNPSIRMLASAVRDRT